MSQARATPFGAFQLRPSHLASGPNPHVPGSIEHRLFERGRRVVGARDLPYTVPTTFAPLDREQRAVALLACSRATDAREARHLLTVLGLLEQPQDAS